MKHLPTLLAFILLGLLLGLILFTLITVLDTNRKTSLIIERLDSIEGFVYASE